MPPIKSILNFLLLWLLLPLAGCSLIAIGYNHADNYLGYTINNYVSYNSAQKEIIDQDIKTYMAWHRHIMLPEYVSFLQELQRFMQSGASLKKDDVSGYRKEVRALYFKTLMPVITPGAHLMSGLNTGQINELALSFSKENQKLIDKEISGNYDEQLSKRAEKIIDFIDQLSGDFTGLQLQKIREMNRNLPFATPLYLSEQQDNQSMLIELLKDHKSEEEIAAALGSWLYTPEAGRNDDEKKLILDFESGTDEMIANIYQMLDAQQKATLLKNIVNYINTFQELASSK